MLRLDSHLELLRNIDLAFLKLRSDRVQYLKMPRLDSCPVSIQLPKYSLHHHQPSLLISVWIEDIIKSVRYCTKRSWYNS